MKINSNTLQITGLTYQAKTIKTKNTEPAERKIKLLYQVKPSRVKNSRKMPSLIELPRGGKYQRSKTFTMEDGKGSHKQD